MNCNVELLNYIYQNSEMGVTTIEQLLNIVEDKDFNKLLESQLKEYKTINKTAKDLLETNHCDEKGIGSLEKITTYIMINMKTLTDKSSAHVAEMMMTGSNMGVINAIKNIKKYENHAEKDILDLMEKLLKFEEDNIQQLKGFL